MNQFKSSQKELEVSVCIYVKYSALCFPGFNSNKYLLLGWLILIVWCKNEFKKVTIFWKAFCLNNVNKKCQILLIDTVTQYSLVGVFYDQLHPIVAALNQKYVSNYGDQTVCTVKQCIVYFKSWCDSM